MGYGEGEVDMSDLLFLADVAPGGIFLVYGFFVGILVVGVVLLVLAFRLIGNIVNSSENEGIDDDENEM